MGRAQGEEKHSCDTHVLESSLAGMWGRGGHWEHRFSEAAAVVTIWAIGDD